MKKPLSIVILVILLVINFNLLKSSLQSQAKLEELSQGEDKIRELEQENIELKEELQNRNSPFFIEQEARNRLGFVKPGETVVVVEDESIEDWAEKATREKTNFQKWLDLLSI